MQKKSPSVEGNSRRVRQQIPRRLWNQTVRYTHCSQQLAGVSILRHMHPERTCSEFLIL
jgi:hypothetical protein